MRFTELESIMEEKGVNTLAEISRILNTTPQAVSNWKARDQVPYHIVAKLNRFENTPEAKSVDFNTLHNAQFASIALEEQEDGIPLMDVLLPIVKNLKSIILFPFITVFFTFIYVQFIQEPLFRSTSNILLPGNSTEAGNLSGLASQFGLAVPQATSVDLSSPSIFPSLIKSRTFAERVLNKSFFSEKYGQEMSLFAILTYGLNVPKSKSEIRIQSAVASLQSMLNLTTTGPIRALTVVSDDPLLAKQINEIVIIELESLSRLYKNKEVNEKYNFIEQRIETVSKDLENSEQLLKEFRENNIQVSSPALQLEVERLSRDVELQKSVFLTLKQQLELTKIEKVQRATIFQILDSPHIPLAPFNIDKKTHIILAAIIGLFSGLLFVFLKNYIQLEKEKDRKKVTSLKSAIKKSVKNIFYDHYFVGIMTSIFIIGSPYFFMHKSENPQFFGLYSGRLFVINLFYLAILSFLIVLFMKLKLDQKKKRK